MMDDTSNIDTKAAEGNDAQGRASGVVNANGFDTDGSALGPDAQRPDARTNRERIVADTGLDARIAAIVEPVAEQMGYHLVRVRITGNHGTTVQIMAERHDGTMTVDDCEALSRAIAPALDVEDPIDRAYHLEVSSPGIDRPLVRRHDFALWAGHLMKLETREPVMGRRRYRGRVVSVGEDGFVLEADTPTYGGEPRVAVPFSQVQDARLILTDELIEASLKADKAARKARGETQPGVGREGEGANDNSASDA